MREEASSYYDCYLVSDDEMTKNQLETRNVCLRVQVSFHKLTIFLPHVAPECFLHAIGRAYDLHAKKLKVLQQ